MLELTKIINDRMAELEITVTDLSEHTYIGRNTIYNIRTGRSRGTMTTVEDILDALGLKLVVREKYEQEGRE